MHAESNLANVIKSVVVCSEALRGVEAPARHHRARHTGILRHLTAALLTLSTVTPATASPGDLVAPPVQVSQAQTPTDLHPAPPFAIQGEWQSTKQAQDVHVYTAAVKDSNFLAFKAVTTLPFDLDTVLNAIMDHERYPKWYDNCQSSETLATLSPHEAVLRIVVKTPFPLANRDLINRATVARTAERAVVTLRSEPDFVPEKKGLVRMTRADGFWLLEAVNEGTRVSQVYHADAKAKAPAWVVNRFIVDGPIRSLSNLRIEIETRPAHPVD